MKIGNAEWETQWYADVENKAKGLRGKARNWQVCSRSSARTATFMKGRIRWTASLLSWMIALRRLRLTLPDTGRR